MLVITKSSDLLMNKTFGGDNIVIASFDNMITQFAVDPTASNPTRDIFVVTSEDVKAKKFVQQFKEALACKHPNVKVLYISKKAKGDTIEPTLQGLNGYLVNPKSPQLKEEIARIIDADTITEAAAIQEREYSNQYGSAPSGMGMGMGDGTGMGDFPPIDLGIGTNNDVPVPIPEANTFESADQNYDVIPDYKNQQAFESANIPEYEQPVEHRVEVPELEAPIVQPVDFTKMDTQSDSVMTDQLLSQIQNARTVTDIDVLMRELTATAVVKNLIDSNATYGAIESKLQSINNAIFEIMRDDKTYPRLTEKLTAVRALLHDRAFVSGKGNTLLEQRVEEIIDTICTKTAELVDSRLSELDVAIRRIRTNREMDTGDVRLAGISEERTNLILELSAMQNSINNIYRNSDILCTATMQEIGAQSVDLTGSESLNQRIKASGDTIIDDETLIAIRSLGDLAASKLPDSCKDMLRNVVIMQKVLNDILSLDKEQIAAMQATIDYLKSKNIEDTVIAEKLLKKCMRIYIGVEGTGRTIIPYLMSYQLSRRNSNVLLFDITGTGKYDSYGIKYSAPETFLSGIIQQPFCVVSGDVTDTVATGQRIVTALNRAADYYRVINVIMRPDQKELFESISDDILCTNYIVDPNPNNIEMMARVLSQTMRDTIGTRVIFNKCNVAITPIVDKLGLQDVCDVQFCIMPYIDKITDAAIRKYNPCSLTQVSVLVEEALRYV